MDERLKALKEQALKEIAAIKNSEEFQRIQEKYFSRTSGELAKLLKDIKEVAADLRPKVGAAVNEARHDIEQALGEKLQQVGGSLAATAASRDAIDVTQSLSGARRGHLHPLSQVQYELEDVFASMGFMVLDGPELESDYYNFEALNIPWWHPARETQDTFYIQHKGDRLLMRTHTSPVQVRAMQQYGAPMRAVVPGRVFRNEATDASHEHTFDQMEGMMIGEDISITNLIAVMKELLRGIFKRDDIEVRLRPGYFPFVEPGFEMDIRCLICAGKGCPVCKHSGWVELMPCGMIHPNVLEAGKIDSKKYTGFAFGLGLTRLVMMRYGIEDIRHLKNPDLRFVNQF